MPTLFIIRGISGSGKSTYASKLGVVTFEADQFFMYDNDYKWSGDRIKSAHAWCKSMVEKVMLDNIDVCVSNTSTKLREFLPYIELAKTNEYTVKVIRCIGNFKNTHSVPEETLIKMRERFEDYEGEEFYDPRG